MKKILSILLCLVLILGLTPTTASAAPEWPAGVSIGAESGIVMDANTGAVLWGQNMHTSYYPASITKIMTALLVLENCNLDDTVTFSYEAVHNVEFNSSNASISEGDTLTVRECLYALLLKSANEAANGLAEHLSGSIDAFANLMNERAAQLGCTDTHFANPNGLNNPDHYTSAYDMALISRAAFALPEFVEIDSTTYHVLTPTKIEPEGLAISPGHKMVKKNSGYYYPGIIGGKTGYTLLAGNTLVTCAERDGMKLICVILNGSTPQYYKDTKALLDFGFRNFHSVKASDYEPLYQPLEEDLTIGGLPIDRPDALILDPDSEVTLPKTAEFSDASKELTYEMSPSDPKDAVAKILYTYNERQVGCTYLMINQHIYDLPTAAPTLESTSPDAAGKSGSGPDIIARTQPEETLPPDASGESLSEGETAAGAQSPAGGTSADDPAKASADGFSDPSAPTGGKAGQGTENDAKKLPVIWIVLIFAVILAILISLAIVFKLRSDRREEEDREIRRQRRMQRLRDAGYSTEEFDLMMERRRSSYTTKKSGRRKSHLKFK